MFLKTQSVYLQRNYCTGQADFDEMTFFYVKKPILSIKGMVSWNIFLHLLCEWIHLLTKNSFTMNTKKVFFGLLAVAFLAMTAVSTSVVKADSDQTTSIKKSQLKKL